MIYLLIPLIVINLYGFAIMRKDKLLAVHHKRRISEKTLFTVAWLFGSPGILAGMWAFRHKTLHGKFVWGVPAILLLQCGLVWAVWRYLL